MNPRIGILPGFRRTLTFTIGYLALVVIVPLGALVLKATQLTFGEFVHALLAQRTLAALRLSFGAATAAAAINAVCGLAIAWVLVRYRFAGRSLIDAVVDLPFALPTAVAGIALTFLYSSNGWFGLWIEKIGVHVAFTPLGVVIALAFVGLPFVVRTVEPVLQDLDLQLEEASASLGATRVQTVRRVILPAVWPSLLTGATLAFARAVGEYGSVVFISGNMPMKTEIAPFLIVTQLEQYDYAGAAAIGVLMLIASFAILLALNGLQAMSRRRATA